MTRIQDETEALGQRREAILRQLLAPILTTKPMRKKHCQQERAQSPPAVMRKNLRLEMAPRPQAEEVTGEKQEPRRGVDEPRASGCRGRKPART